MSPRTRKATASDIPVIVAMLAPHARAGRALPRTHRSVAEDLRDWTVAIIGGRIVGAASVGLVDVDLAEIGVVVGQDDDTESGLIDAILSEAGALGVSRIFVATDDPAPYEAWGFQQRPVATIPEKRDRQCLRCPRMPRCLKVALDRDVAMAPLRAVG